MRSIILVITLTFSLCGKSQVLSSNYLFSTEDRSQITSDDWKLREMIFDPHSISLITDKSLSYLTVSRLYSDYSGEHKILSTIWKCHLIDSEENDSIVVRRYTCSFENANDFFSVSGSDEVHVKIISGKLSSIYWYVGGTDKTTTRIRYIPKK